MEIFLPVKVFVVYDPVIYITSYANQALRAYAHEKKRIFFAFFPKKQRIHDRFSQPVMDFFRK